MVLWSTQPRRGCCADRDAKEPKWYGVQPKKLSKNRFQRLNSLDKSLQDPGSNPKSPGPIFFGEDFFKAPKKPFNLPAEPMAPPLANTVPVVPRKGRRASRTVCQCATTPKVAFDSPSGTTRAIETNGPLVHSATKRLLRLGNSATVSQHTVSPTQQNRR
jgi:hypothetical protein